MRRPPFNSVDLPELPADWETTDLFDRRVPLSRWEDWASRLGFSMVLEHKGVSLESRLKRTRSARFTGRQGPNVHSVPLANAEATLLRYWTHPSGVLWAMRGWDEKPGGDWSVLDCEWWALAEQSLVAGDEKHSQETFFRADGSCTRVLYWRENSKSRTDFAEAWAEARSAGATGRLRPLSQWGRDFRVLNMNTMTWRATLPWEVWDSLVDWGTRRVPEQALHTPSARIGWCAWTCHKRRGELSAAWKALTEKAPADTHALFRMLGQSAADSHQSRLSEGEGVPARAQALGRQAREGMEARFSSAFLTTQVVDRLRQALSRFDTKPEWLSQTERRRIERWVAGVLDPAQPLAPKEDLEFAPWGELELVLLNPSLPGVWPRALALIDRFSDADLREKTKQPDGEGMTLQLRLARALLDVPNASRENQRLPDTLAGALAGLDRLADRLGTHGWNWDGRGHNVWHWALGWHINLPHDEDLVATHHERLSAFLAWCDRRQVATPDWVQWEHEGKSFQTALDDPMGFVRDWEEGGNPYRGDSPSERWALLGPVVRLKRSQQLETRLRAASPNRRPRM